MTLNDLERPKRKPVQKRCVFGAHSTNLNEDRPINDAFTARLKTSTVGEVDLVELISNHAHADTVRLFLAEDLFVFYF